MIDKKYSNIRLNSIYMSTTMDAFLTFVDVEGQGADGDADHTLRMVEELDGFCVQGKVIGMLWHRKGIIW